VEQSSEKKGLKWFSALVLAGGLIVALPTAATAGKNKNKNKNNKNCIIQGTQGIDDITLQDEPVFDGKGNDGNPPSSSFQILQVVGRTTVCTFGGDDFVDLREYQHADTARVSTAEGNDTVCAVNGALEEVDAGVGTDAVEADTSDSVSNAELTSSADC